MALPVSLASRRTQANFRNDANPTVAGLIIHLCSLLISDSSDDTEARTAGKGVVLCSGEGAPAGSLGTNIRGIYFREDAAADDAFVYVTVDGSTWTAVPAGTFLASLVTVLDTAAPANYWTTDTAQGVADEIKAAVGGTNSTTRTYDAAPARVANNDTLVTAVGKLDSAWKGLTTAQALALFTADQITNAVLIQGIVDGAFLADAATRALFTDAIWTPAKLTGASVAPVPAAGTVALSRFSLNVLTPGAPGAYNLDNFSGLAAGEWADVAPDSAASPATLRDNAVGAGNIWTHRAQSVVLAALPDRVRVTFDGTRYTVSQPSVQAGSATSAPSVADTDVTKVRMAQHIPPGIALAPGVAYHAAYPAGAPIDDAVGPWTMPVPPRTVQVVLGIGGVNPVSVTIDGTGPTGTAIQDVIPCAGAGTYQGVLAFTSITRVRTNVDPGGTVTLQTGNGFGLAVSCSDIDRVGVDGVRETPTSTNPATGTVVPATAPDGMTHHYTVEYRAQHLHGMASHTHTA